MKPIGIIGHGIPGFDESILKVIKDAKVEIVVVEPEPEVEKHVYQLTNTILPTEFPFQPQMSRRERRKQLRKINKKL